MIYFGAADGRICLVYPYFGHALIGSTDIRTDDPDRAVCDEDETDYMLKVTGELFPGLALGRRHVLYRYCGVRPLPATDTSDPGAISRDHSIAVDRIGEQGPPVLSLIGGKWTTFRGFAEEAADRVLALLGRQRRRSTQALAIGGGAGYPATAEARRAWAGQVTARLGLDAARARILLDRYGSFGEQVAAWCARGEDRPLASLPDYSVREIERVCREETVARLADVLFRRLPVALSARLSCAAIDEVGAIAARTLEWTSEQLEREIAHVQELAVGRHGVDLGQSSVSATQAMPTA
jgi:glycerol-3-phosphate dehydrogenase